MSGGNTRSASSRRFGLRFSLRALLLATLVICLVFAALGWNYRRAKLQAPAVATLKELGATVRYDHVGTDAASFCGWQYKDANRSVYPDWLIARLGVDFFHDVTEVRHQDSRKLADKDIERFWQAIGMLHKLERIETAYGTTLPGVLQHVARHGELKSVTLRWANLGESDFAVLGSLPIVELNLNETPVAEEGFIHIGRCISLVQLHLHHAQVTDRGACHLGNLSHLETLRLSGTSVGNEGAKAVSRLPNLKALNLRHTAISDSALAHLESSLSLEDLDVAANDITPEGLSSLRASPRLRRLSVSMDQLDEGDNYVFLTNVTLKELHVVPPRGNRFAADGYQQFLAVLKERRPDMQFTAGR